MIKRYLAKRDNPWELLAIAALIFVPGIVMLLQKKPMIAFPLGSGSWRDPGPMYGVEIISPSVAHIFGWLAILFSVLMVFYTSGHGGPSPVIQGHTLSSMVVESSNKTLERTAARFAFTFKSGLANR